MQSKLNTDKVTVDPYPMTQEEHQIDTQIYTKQKLNHKSTSIHKKRGRGQSR